MIAEELEALAADIKRLTPANRLRLAAGLLDARSPELAHRIARIVTDELAAAMMLRDLEPRP